MGEVDDEVPNDFENPRYLHQGATYPRRPIPPYPYHAQSTLVRSQGGSRQRIPTSRTFPGPARMPSRFEAFVSGVGKVLVVADYAQLEMRLMAHFSGDQKMIKAIRDGVDLHCLSVSEMYGIPYDEVIAAVKAEKKIKRKELERDLTARARASFLPPGM